VSGEISAHVLVSCPLFFQLVLFINHIYVGTNGMSYICIGASVLVVCVRNGFLSHN
jgi:hypothetical protein